METYILKAIICSTVLIILYFLFLQRERSFKFNRFFLLFALVFSYAIPLIRLKLPAVETPKSTIIFQESVSEMMVIPAQTAERTFDWTIVLLCIYAGVAFFLLLKSVYSVTKILLLKGNLIKIDGQKTKILEENISPFSFMNTLYIGKSYFNNENSIDQRIFLHEKVHISQKHSLDLILIEVLMIISWFNPALYFYKKAIVTNHEFLADENVISKDFDVKSYQQLILNEISTHNNLQFTNQFNYHNTKKRFIMMTKPNSKFSQLKKVLFVPAMFALAFLFVQKTYASEFGNTLMNTNEIKNSVTQFSAENPYQDFLKLLEKYNPLLENRKFDDFSKKLTEEDKMKFGLLWEQLSKDERNSLPIFLMSENIQFKNTIPTIQQLKDFGDSKKYGVWIDSKKVQNYALGNYKNSDFSNVNISKIYKNAKNSKNPQPFQVSLMTNEYFNKSNRENSQKKGYLVGVVSTFYERTKTDTIRKKVVERKAGEVTKEVNYKMPPAPTHEEMKKVAKQNNAENVQPTSTSVLTQVEQLPEFPGGFNAFRNLVASSFNGAVLKGDEKLLKTTIKFVIDVDGKVSDVSAQGENETFNKEAVRTAKEVNANQLWKPAMKDGKPVRYRFTMPLTMSFG